MQQVHTAKIVQQAHTAETSAERDQWRELQDEPSTSRTTEIDNDKKARPATKTVGKAGKRLLYFKIKMLFNWSA